MVNEKTPFEVFFAALKYYLPHENILEPSVEDEKAIIENCILHQQTYEIKIKKKLSVCGMTRNGYFILKGKPYIWTWKESYCPNWIYKFKNSVEVWSSPLNKPWELYQGRFTIQINKNTLCFEGQFKTGLIHLTELLKFHDLNLKILETILTVEEFVLYKKLLDGNWKSRKKIQTSHPFLPHLSCKEDKEIFLCFMIKHLVCEEIPIIDSNDINYKRIIHTEWLLGHTIKEYVEKNNDKALNYMMKRIYYHGQLLDNISIYESLSHVTRVVRGSPSFVCTEKRQIHPSHKGVYCPYRASEGENIGLTVDLTTDVQISSFCNNFENKSPIALLLQNFKESPISYTPKDFELHCQSINWSWNDVGRIIYKNPHSIGFIAHEIIFRRHLPPVRTMYATTHIKQANNLAYNQIPIIQSSTSKTSIKNGCNALVAVSGFHGWNIEDAIVVNKSFIERGGLYSIHTSIVNDKINCKKEKYTNLPKYHQQVKEKDILYSKINETGKTIKIKNQKGQIENVTLFNNDNSLRIELRHLHKPEIGDKFSTRHGQKGVIGCIVPQDSMPYDDNGVCPDIIINPAHLPSRLTTSQLLESFFGKNACIEGKNIYDFVPDDNIQLKKPNCGKSIFYCGITGKKIGNPLFFGTVYYFSLKHIVNKKCRFRNTGPTNLLTGQPTKGKQSNGGLRFGEMERDAIRTRNNDLVIKDRLQSDKTIANVCKKCGWLEPNNNCCENYHHVQIEISKTTKLMLMEMYCMGIFPKLNLKCE